MKYLASMIVTALVGLWLTGTFIKPVMETLNALLDGQAGNLR